jgi:hypothetical protein
MRVNQRELAPEYAHLNRATRVATGWRSDALFVDKSGRPKPLLLKAGNGGFWHLVRKYSGDIPARAMLLEMKRLGMIQTRPNKTVTLVRDAPAMPRTAVATVRAISPWVALLAETQRTSQSFNLTSSAQQTRISFDSVPQLLAAMRELETRRRSFINGIEQLAKSQKTNGKLELAISVAVAAAQPLARSKKKSCEI